MCPVQFEGQIDGHVPAICLIDQKRVYSERVRQSDEDRQRVNVEAGIGSRCSHCGMK